MGTAQSTSNGVQETNLPGLGRFARGKVRDIYAVGDDQLLIVSTDRVSAFDVVMPNPIPDRGKVLTQLSTFWFRQTGDIVRNHLIADDLASFPESVRAQTDVLVGRSMLVRRTKRIDVECVARGYLTGSGLLDYRATGEVCGIALPEGLEDGSRLEQPIFTPATKAALGEHDENVSFDGVVAEVGEVRTVELRDLTLRVYATAEEIARERGIVLADTKLEFGARPDGTTVLGDEVLTPDSSRFWPADQWRPGRAQPSYDKQFVRDWLLSEASGWDRHSGEQPPPLPEDVVAQTRAKYVEAYERLTGRRFA